MTAPWQTEHDPSFAVPEEISSALPDRSWHNDACPSFGVNATPESVCVDVLIWVEHPDRDRRESGLDGFRLYVNCSAWDVEGQALLDRVGIIDCQTGDPGYGTDDPTEALAEYARRKTLLEQNGVTFDAD